MLPMILAAALLAPAAQAPAPAASYVPQRVFDTRQKGFGDFETMLADLARADAVFVGEQHDDPNTHRLELAIIEGLSRRGVSVVLAMEMFERDVQDHVDQCVGGTATEEQFLAASRPWPRYGSDYRAIVEYARANHLPIVASNVPRRIASDVSKTGMSVVDGLGNDRRLVAGAPLCPTSGDYYERFAEMMGDHPAGEGRRPTRRAERALLFRAVLEGRDDGGVGGGGVSETCHRPRDHRPRQRRVPQRLR
jgi:hypothetical protein